jgi:hypothetical protein
MDCRECGTDLTNAEHKMVAEWPFCLDCFQRLLERPKQPEPAAEPEPDPVEPPSAPTEGPGVTFQVNARTEPAKGPSDAPREGPGVSFQISARTAPPPAETAERCSLCGGPVSSGGVKLGPMVICTSCTDGLGQTAAAPAREPVRDAVPESHGVQAAPSAPEVEPKAFINCAGCGRRVPTGGSKPVGDEHYCPDCFATLSPEATTTEPTAAPPEPAVAPPAAPAAQGDGLCDSCERPHPGAVLQEVEGFRLCGACVSTDPVLALQVARARHQRRLQHLQGELD